MRFRPTRPLEVLHLPTQLHPQTGPVWTGLVIARFPGQVKWYMAFSCRENATGSHQQNGALSKNQLQRELDLARSVRVRGLEKAGRNAVLGGKDVDFSSVSRLNKLGGISDEAILRDLNPPVVAVQQIEGLGHQFQFHAVAGIETAGKSQVSGGIVRSEERVAGHPRKAVVVVVSILIGVAGDGGAYRPPAAHRDHPGCLPVVEE